MRGRWRSSVRTRVTIGASAVLALALLITILASSGLVRRSLTRDTELALVARVDATADFAKSGTLPPILPTTGHEVGQVEVIDAAGTVVSRTPAVAKNVRFDAVAAPDNGRLLRTTVDGGTIGGEAGEAFRLVGRSVQTPTGTVTIYAASTIRAASRAQQYLQRTLLIGAAALLLLSAFGIWFLVRRAFAPVDAMRAEVDQIEASDISRRVTAGASDDEVAKLGKTLNHLLDRLQEAGERQQLFAAAASHELRSPLSAIRTELEVGMLFPDRADWGTIARDVMIEIERLESLSRDLRALNRPDTALTIRQCKLDEVVRREVALRTSARGVRYTTSIEPAITLADERGVVQVIRNLLDNAERHAATQITVTVGTTNESPFVSVRNDGETIPAHERDRIFEPFRRLDEARSLDDGGNGLGLAIARTVMHGMGGTLTATDIASGAEFIAVFAEAAPAG